MKFKAPLHVTAIFACGFEVRADENGVAELPEDAPSILADAMKSAGWELIDEEPPVELPGPAKGAVKQPVLTPPPAPSGDGPTN